MEFFHEQLAKEIELNNKHIERFKKAERVYNACYDLIEGELNILAGEEPANFDINSPGYFLIWLHPKFTTVAEIAEIVDEWAEFNSIKITHEKMNNEYGYYRIECQAENIYIDIDIHVNEQCKAVKTGTKTVDVIEYICEDTI